MRNFLHLYKLTFLEYKHFRQVKLVKQLSHHYIIK